MNKLPYVGLRSFQRDDNEIFFGRKNCINELFDLLEHSNFFAVVGEAYCGKSSLVCCGLEAKLLQNNTTDSIVQWNIANFHPDSKPFFQVADGLLENDALGDFFIGDFENKTAARQFLRQNLTQGSLSLHAVLDQKPLPVGHKLLLVCDQFEKIFHLWKEDKETAEKFVNFLIDSSRPHPLSPITKHDIYVVITMRSSYLDKTSIFPKLESSIRNNLYLTPRLNKEQLKEAITQPVAVMNEISTKVEEHLAEDDDTPPIDHEPSTPVEVMDRLYENLSGNPPNTEEQTDEPNEVEENEQQKNDHTIDSKLVNHLLEVIDGSGEQLSLLQHLLMRMWELDSVGAVRHLTLEVYKRPRIGSIYEALLGHLEESYYFLKDYQITIAEVLFRKLMTFKDSDRPRLLYSPVKLDEIVALANTSIERVIEVVDIFRSSDRGFLTPLCSVELKADNLIEISHESIVRRWKRLQEWKDKEMQIKKNYQDLDLFAHEHSEQGGALLKSAQLNRLWQWYKEDDEFNERWALHYGCNFHLSKSFLLKSRIHESMLKYLKISALVGIGIGIMIVLFRFNEKRVQKEEMLDVFFQMREELIVSQTSSKLEKKFQEFTNNTPSNLEGWLYYGWILSKQGKWKDSEEAFSKAYEINEKDLEVLFYLTEVLTKEKKFGKAVELLKKALKKSPENPQLLQQLGNVLSHQDKLKDAKSEQLKQAINNYRKSLEITPDNDETLSNLGHALGMLGEHKEALEYLHKALEINKDNPNNWKRLGLEYMENNQINEAVKAFTTALGIEPSDDKNLRNLGLAFLKNNNLKKATKAFQDAVILNKESDENHRNLGDVLMARNEFDAALKAYNIAQNIKMTRATLIQKAKLLSKQKKFDEASKLYQQALTLEESDWE